MAKYRVIKLPYKSDAYHVQKKCLWSNHWHTIQDFSYLENAMLYYAKFVCGDIPGSEVIVESK